MKKLSLVLLVLISLVSIFFYSKRENLSLEERVGQLFILGFAGQQPDYYITRALSLRNFGGVLLLGDNIGYEEQVKQLTTALNKLPKTKPFIAIDQEGGLVARVAFEPTAKISQREIENDAQAYDIAKKRAVFLKNLGINLNFSPVVDVSTDEKAGIYDRTFKTRWGSLGSEMNRGYADGGILSSIKHFPSYGNFTGNVEEEIPTKELSPEEEKVFIESAKNAPFLMISPIIISNIDPKNPAPISKKVISYIREKLKFNGLIITDDIMMQSIQKKYDPHVFAVNALKAGVDIVMFSGNPSEAVDAYNYLLDQVKKDKILYGQIDNSVTKILRIKEKI